MQTRIGQVGYLSLVILLLFAGHFLYGAPVALGGPLKWSELIGAFFIFCFSGIALLSLGTSLQGLLRLNGPRLVLAPALGTGAASLLLALLGVLGGIGPQYQVFYLISLLLLSLIPLLSKAAEGRPLVALRRFALNRLDYWGFGILAVVALYYAYESFPPHPFWDPLYYDLPAVKAWSNAGRIFLPPNFPAFSHAAAWDYLFLIGSALLTNPPNDGMIALQSYGQWTHVFFGLFGSMTCVLWLFKRFGMTGFWLSLAVLCSISFSTDTSSLQNVARYAKNDWGSVFWFLAGLILLIEAKGDRIQSLTGGILLGLSVAAKFVALYLVIPFFLLWLPLSGFKPRQIAWLLGGVTAGLAPILIRNFAFTGNPVHPAFSSIFGNGDLSPSWIYGLNQFQPEGLSGRVMNAFRVFGELFTENPLSFGTLLGIFALKKERRQALKPAIHLWLTCMLSLLIFAFGVGTSAEVRLLGPTAVLLNAFSAFFLVQIFLPIAPKPITFVGALMPLALIAHSAPWWRTPYELRENPGPSGYLYGKYRFAQLLAWASVNQPEEGQVGSIDENRLYYLEPLLKVRRIWDWPGVDRELSKAQDLPEVVRVLQKSGFRYLLTTQTFLDPYYNRRVRDLILRGIQENPKSIVFRDEWVIISLNKLVGGA